ncbi:MAG: hypothetical protein PHR45_04210 [Muribaculaceae bacterium]|nr:hypothetical protein [Muribaculaceae bacterium]
MKNIIIIIHLFIIVLSIRAEGQTNKLEFYKDIQLELSANEDSIRAEYLALNSSFAKNTNSSYADYKALFSYALHHINEEFDEELDSILYNYYKKNPNEICYLKKYLNSIKKGQQEKVIDYIFYSIVYYYFTLCDTIPNENSFKNELNYIYKISGTKYYYKVKDNL